MYEIRQGRLENSVFPREQFFSLATGVLPVELLAYQVSMAYTTNWLRQLYSYTWCYTGLSEWRNQSHLHT